MSLPETVPSSADFNDKKVTIYIATKKYEATQVKVWRAPYAQYRDAFHFQLKPKGARNLRGFVEHYMPRTVIVDGWGHPEFDFLLRSFHDAASVPLSPGVSVKMVEYTLGTDGEAEKNKYQVEFEGYLEGLDPSRILFDTRGCIVHKKWEQRT